MIKPLFLANSLLTLPFAILILAIPATLFANFGLELDAGGVLVARGYGATLAGYGLAYWGLRNISGTVEQKALLLAAIAFNLIEAIIQSMAALDGIVLPMIWGTIVLHVILFLLCGLAYLRIK